MTSSPIPAARSQYLHDLLAQVPDPRRWRGRRHSLAGLLTVGIAAVIAGSRSFAAIGQWAADAGPEVLGAARGPAEESTFRRAFARPVQVPDRPGGRAVRAMRRDPVRRSRGHVARAAVAGPAVPLRRRRAGRLADRWGKLAALLTSTLLRLVDEDQGETWVAEHDQIDYGLEAELAGLPADQAAQVREASARWSCGSRSTPPPIPARCRVLAGARPPASRRLPLRRHPEDDTGLGAPVRRGARPPAHRLGGAGRRRVDHGPDPYPADDPAGPEPAARLHAAEHGGRGAPLVILDAGYSADTPRYQKRREFSGLMR
jgi:hypothetical protein